jgi:molecular chaperone DnaK (HSP70)
MSVVSGYRVAVDYGTSFTAAAVVDGSAPEVVEFASERHSRHLSSLVLVDQRGELHVGVRATAKRATVPADHVCVAPKRQLGPDPVQLGTRSLTGAEVVGATLAKVADEVLHQHNGTPPDELVMTHPAAWSAARCEVLTRAAVIAGLAADPTAVRLISEPAAAASFYAGAHTGPKVPVGGSVAVYDLGGGTFDCAVLTRTPETWVLAGPPGGDQHLGGEDFDEALLDWVAERILDKDPDAWERFENDQTPRGRRDWVMLLEEITTAKHNLSHEDATEIVLPPGALPVDSLLITRTELTVLIGQALDLSMHAFEQCLDAAQTTPAELSAVYLTGGSSRIPAVKAELHRRFGLEPTTYKDPKTITALGALTCTPAGSTSADENASTEPGPIGLDASFKDVIDAFSGQRTATVTITPAPALGGLGALGVSFRVKVDGAEVRSWFRGRKSWQPVVSELAPGRHTVEAYCTDILKPARATLQVEVVSGQKLHLVYEQPTTTFQKARLTVT